MNRRRTLRWLAVAGGVSACARTSATAVVSGEDGSLLQEVISRQERRVADAQARVAALEHELRLVQMRRRMLERAGRYDLATRLDTEEQDLGQRLAAAQRAAADEEDALAIYRRRGAPGATGRP